MKYDPLREHLSGLHGSSRVRMTFAEIAAIIGEALPPAAFKYREWWANQTDTTRRSWAAAWLDAGFKVEDVHQDPESGWVEFVRQ